MEVFTLDLGKWVRYLTARNPLVRATDRLEAWARLLLVVIVLVAAPIAGAVGTVTNDSHARQYAADRTTRHRVVATVTDDSVLSPRAYEEPFATSIRWNDRGTEHTGEVRTYRMHAGDTMSLWVDAEGNRTTRPLTDDNAATEAITTAFGLWFTTVGVAAAAWTVLRLRLNRSRHATWDRELEGLAGNDGRTNQST